jgi:hypothetical protein
LNFSSVEIIRPDDLKKIVDHVSFQQKLEFLRNIDKDQPLPIHKFIVPRFLDLEQLYVEILNSDKDTYRKLIESITKFQQVNGETILIYYSISGK